MVHGLSLASTIQSQHSSLQCSLTLSSIRQQLCNFSTLGDAYAFAPLRRARAFVLLRINNQLNRYNYEQVIKAIYHNCGHLCHHSFISLCLQILHWDEQQLRWNHLQRYVLLLWCYCTAHQSILRRLTSSPLRRVCCASYPLSVMIEQH